MPASGSSPHLRELYFVETDTDAYGPWQSRPVADLVAKIMNMQDESSEAVVIAMDLDPYASSLIAGLRPFKIAITRTGHVVHDKQIGLCWPPEPESCKLREEESIVEYFVWAKTQPEAFRIMVSLSSQPPKYRPVFDTDLPLTEDTEDPETVEDES